MKGLLRGIKQYKWCFVYAAIICLYLIIKMYRDIYVTSESQGGIWNLIQLFFFVLGLLILLSRYNSVVFSRGNIAVKYFLCFSFLSLFLAFFSISVINVASLYGLGIIPYGSLVLVTSIVLGKIVPFDTKSFQWLYISTFLALCIVFFSGRQQEILNEYFEGANLTASVYYILCFFPLVLAVKPRWHVFFFFLVAACLLISNKRAGTIALGVCLIYYFSFSKLTNRLKAFFILLPFVCAVLFYLMYFIVGNYGVDVMGRMETLEESGGAGRLARWTIVLDAIGRSNIIELIFGHGGGAAYRMLKGEVHNDFLSVFFDYGIVSLLLYALYFFASFRMWWKMRKDNYRYEASVFMLNVITLFLALFSFYIIRPTYITASMFSYGLFMSDWYKQKYKTKYVRL